MSFQKMQSRIFLPLLLIAISTLADRRLDGLGEHNHYVSTTSP